MDDRDKDKLRQAIQAEDVKEIVRVTAYIPAEDDEACMEIAEAYLVACEMEDDKENRKQMEH